MSKWAVRREFEIVPGDVQADGTIDVAAIRRWITGAADAYLEHCEEIARLASTTGARLQQAISTGPGVRAVTGLASVTVSATAVEVHPDSFTIAVRIRQVGEGDAMPVAARCVVTLNGADGDPIALGDGVRDELIALERGARQYN